MYTVKQVADLAGVSVRTLHHYDAVGLLRPTRVGANGYRYYDDDALLRLQQILLYREIGMELAQIKDILNDPGFDVLDALGSHRQVIQERIARLHNLLSTIDDTIQHVMGEAPMGKKRLFAHLSPEEEAHNTRLARLQYGPEYVNESVRRWQSYSNAQKEIIREEGNQLYAELAAALAAGTSAHSAEVQAILARWHEHIRYFYEPTLEVLRGLGELYSTNPAFMTHFEKLHPDLPAYLQAAIDQYIDDLEDAELRRILAEDEADHDQTA